MQGARDTHVSQGVFMAQEALERAKKGCHQIPTHYATVMSPPVGILTQQTQSTGRILEAQYAREVLLEMMEG
ncbi:hypothetical protein [Marinobacter alexandrii]|uniref:hypothetical protein n=1 Tax=Marinobacter alexandrii TaxID=2570351 RepID=UPI0032976D6B